MRTFSCLRLCPCQFVGEGLDRFTPAWYRAHREHHLAAFPDADETTRRTLDQLIDIAEALEAQREKVGG